MSESNPSPTPPGADQANAQPPPGVDAAAWEAMVQQMKQSGAVAGFPGAMGFGMAPFTQPFLYGGFMLPGMMQGGFGLPGGEGEAKGEEDGEGDEDTEDDDGADDGADSSDQETGRGKRKRAARKKKGDGVVKSNSNAALAMLAGAAATKPGAPGNPAAAAAAAAMHQNLGELWGTLNGGAAAGLPAAGLDMSKLTPEQQQQFLTTTSFEGVLDEREVKRMRRKQSNRESARRSRLRKQAECEQLARQVKELGAENARLKEEKMNLVAQVEILNAKLSMSAFGVHALGQGDMQAKQTQDMQATMAAMAQAMQVNGGAMLATGLGIPALDAKALEGGDEAAAAAAAAAASGVPAAGEVAPQQQDGGQ